MQSFLHGNRFKVYAADTDGSPSGIKNGFANATESGEVDYALADVTGMISGGELWLYKWNQIAQTSDFQAETASKVDGYSSNWQISTIFYFGAGIYDGKVPVQECLNLFPHRYSFESFGGNTIYLTRDDITTVWAAHMTVTPYMNRFESFNKETLADAGDCGINVIRFNNGGAGFASTGYVASNLFFYDDGTTGGKISAIGLWPVGSQDSYYMGNGAGVAHFANDISGIMKEDFIPSGPDPYDPGGESGTGGGTGDFDGTGDDIDIPSLPTLSATDTGFITLFNPSTGQLRALANYMWSTGFDLDTFKKLFADPMDCILGLSIVPVAVPNGGSKAVSVGNISTGVTMTLAGSQYVEVDCGTLNVNEFWGAYLDYDPFTKAEIYLPYIGTHPIAVDDIMNKPVHVVYHIDILSGACCAFVKCGGSVLYTFVGQCSCSIPITGNDWTNVVNGALSIAAAIGTMVATGGASAPMAATAIASTAVNSMKPSVEKSGSLGGMGGMLGVQVPYLILTRPRQALPKNQNRFSGYPSFITRGLSSLSGFTEIDSIHLENIPATEQELSEIETLLKGGVIL